MVRVGKMDIKVSEARKILTSFNRMFKTDVEYGKRGKGGKGVYRMTASDLAEQLKNFTVKGKKVGHKTKKDFAYTLTDAMKSLGRVQSSKAKTSQTPATAPKQMKKKEKGITEMLSQQKAKPKNKKIIKGKKQTKKDKADEAKAMKGQKKKSKSKTDKGEEDFTGKKGDVSKSKGKDTKKSNKWRDYVKASKGSGKTLKQLSAEYKANKK